MPSSGARSGTKPNRPKAAGDGRVSRDRTLVCGHTTPAAPAVTGSKTLYLCHYGCGFKEAKR